MIRTSAIVRPILPPPRPKRNAPGTPAPFAVIYVGTNAHAENWPMALARGLRQHGLVVETRPSPRPCDPLPDAPMVAFWAHKRTQLIQHQRSQGRHYLVLERGYFGDRFKMTSLGWDGLNGRANFCNANSPPDRWQKHGWRIPEWKTGGDYILLCGQVPTDTAVRHTQLKSWYQDAIELIRRSYPGVPIRFRPHPLSPTKFQFPNVTTTTGSLDDDLKRAIFTVAFNSNTGVDSLLASVPHFCGDAGSMALPVAIQIDDPKALKSLPSPCRGADREQWARNLAYCQWTYREIESGEAWEHVKKGLE